MSSISPPIAYRDYLRLSPADSLQLGIGGSDAHANRARFEVATALEDEFQRINDAAYARSQWPNEPMTAKPFGLDLVIEHRGDVTAVLDDPRLRDAVRDLLGYRPGSEYINDEDGARWEWFDGGLNIDAIQDKIDSTVSSIRAAVTADQQQTSLAGIASRWTDPAAATDDRDTVGLNDYPAPCESVAVHRGVGQ